jgi:hypothetical protein
MLVAVPRRSLHVNWDQYATHVTVPVLRHQLFLRHQCLTHSPGLLPAADSNNASSRQINGSSKWRLLDHAGRKVSERKKDLDDLLDHLNIDATNPLAVMTQVRKQCLLVAAVVMRQLSHELMVEVAPFALASVCCALVLAQT